MGAHKGTVPCHKGTQPSCSPQDHEASSSCLYKLLSLSLYLLFTFNIAPLNKQQAHCCVKNTQRLTCTHTISSLQIKLEPGAQGAQDWFLSWLIQQCMSHQRQQAAHDPQHSDTQHTGAHLAAVCELLPQPSSGEVLSMASLLPLQSQPSWRAGEQRGALPPLQGHIQAITLPEEESVSFKCSKEECFVSHCLFAEQQESVE